MRHRTHVTKPDQIETYHDQVGYGLWEPATGTVIHTLTIPRGRTAMAPGMAAADVQTFEAVATQGLSTWGMIVPGLHAASSLRGNEDLGMESGAFP